MQAIRHRVGYAPLASALLLSACVSAPAPVPVTPPAPIAAAPVDRCAVTNGAEAAFVLNGQAVQGGMMRGVAPACTRTLTFNGDAIAMGADRAFLIAFDRDSPSSVILRADRGALPAVERTLTVQAGNWRIEHVNASPTGGVPSAEYLERRKPELERIRAARALRPSSDGWRQKFLWPITGRISGLFGAQRIYRGTPGSYHTGTDIAAAKGTPFYAPADGIVVLAADTPFTLEGHLLMVDHGMGLTSAFLHCSSLAVREGAVVKQGQLLGTVGATGRASGPHMHWGMMWNGARLDPQKIAEDMVE